MPRRLLLATLSLLLVVLATACQVHTSVTVDVADDGSGNIVVTTALDADALGRLPDVDGDGTSGAGDLATLVRVDDLEAAGWAVAEPVTDAEGVTSMRLLRPFGTPAEADQILAGLTGPDGGLRDVRVTRTESFGRTRYAFAGTADLSGGLEAFGDEGLAVALDGEPLGEDAAAIEERLGQPLAEVFTLEITARLAGEVTTWQPSLGSEPVALRADRTAYDWPVLGLAAVAAASLVALVAVLAVRLVRSRRA